MGSFSTPLDGLANSLPQSFLANGTVNLDNAWLAKVSRGGSVGNSIKSSLTEYTTTYTDGQFPDSIRPIKYGVDVAMVAQDVSKAATVIPKYTQYVTQAHSKIDELKSQATGKIDESKARIDTNVGKVQSLAGRKARLYGDKAKASVDSAKTQAVQQLDDKKDLVKYE